MALEDWKEALNGAYDVHVDLALSEPSTTETILVAPTPKIKKLWEKRYPGIKVYLSEKVPTYNTPHPEHFQIVDKETSESS